MSVQSTLIEPKGSTQFKFLAIMLFLAKFFTEIVFITTNIKFRTPGQLAISTPRAIIDAIKGRKPLAHPIKKTRAPTKKDHAIIILTYIAVCVYKTVDLCFSSKICSANFDTKMVFPVCNTIPFPDPY